MKCLTISLLTSITGIPNVIDSYAKFRDLLSKQSPELSLDEHPQLLVCGHGAVDDPDASIIYDQTMHLITEKYAKYSEDIVVMRIPPSDQRLCYALLSSILMLIPLQC